MHHLTSREDREFELLRHGAQEHIVDLVAVDEREFRAQLADYFVLVVDVEASGFVLLKCVVCDAGWSSG